MVEVGSVVVSDVGVVVVVVNTSCNSAERTSVTGLAINRENENVAEQSICVAS